MRVAQLETVIDLLRAGSSRNLREQSGITERLEQRPAQGLAELDRTLDSIAEAEPQAVIAKVANVDDARQIEHLLAAEVRVLVQYTRRSRPFRGSTI